MNLPATQMLGVRLPIRLTRSLFYVARATDRHLSDLMSEILDGYLTDPPARGIITGMSNVPPPQDARKVSSFRIGRETLRRLRIYAAQVDRPMYEIVEDALRRYLDSQPPPRE